MAKRRGRVAKKVGTRTYYGPFTGSKQNHGRKIYTWYDSSSGKTGSINAARFDLEQRTGRKLTKNQTVDHKDGNSANDSASNEQVISNSANVAKGNKERKDHPRKYHRKRAS